MSPIPIAEFIAEFMVEYQPPFHAKTTCRLMRQTTREIVQHGALSTTQDLSPAAIFRWMKAHPERSRVTTAVHLRNLRALCNFAVGRSYLTASPFSFNATLKKAVGAKKETKERHHSLVSVGKVLAHLRDNAKGSWEGHRLYALASLVAFTGARALEAQFAEVEDFDLVEGFFAIKPKPKHPLKTPKSEREVPMPMDLIGIVEGWLPSARSSWAFPGVKRMGPWIGGLSGYRPLCRLKQAGEAVGVKGFTFLSLRHSFITHGSGPWHLGDRVIQQIAGHTLVTTQDEYRGRDRDNLRSAVRDVRYPMAAG
jgi:integrase